MRLSRVLAAAGLAVPIVFTTAVVVQGLLHGGYSHMAMPISALSTLRTGWIQNATFFICGCLFAAFAVGLHAGIRPGLGGVAGPALLGVSGVGLIVVGAYPWKIVDGSVVEPAGHVVGVLMTFLGAGIGFVVTSRRMARDASWRGVAAYTRGTGLAMVILFVAFAALAVSADAPLHPWMGAFQRVIVALWFACTAVLALRLRRVARQTDQGPSVRWPRAASDSW